LQLKSSINAAIVQKHSLVRPTCSSADGWRLIFWWSAGLNHVESKPLRDKNKETVKFIRLTG